MEGDRLTERWSETPDHGEVVTMDDILATAVGPPLAVRAGAAKTVRPGDLLENTRYLLDAAADVLYLDEGIRAILRQPERTLVVSLPVKMDNGQVEVFT